MDEPSSTTSVSLLVRIRDASRDERAWHDFVVRYGPRIYSWCRNRGLQPNDAEDVTQEVLTKLAKNLGSFHYDPGGSFRGWLRRVTENTIADFFRGLKKLAPMGGGGTLEELLDTAEAKADLEQRLEAGYDLELLDLAKARVKSAVKKERWKAWEMTAVQQRTGDEVARVLGMKLATVYSIRSKIQSMIAEEIKKIEAATMTEAFSIPSQDSRGVTD